VKVKTENRIMRAKDYVEGLASKGRYDFSSRDAQAALGGNSESIKRAMSRLIAQGELASPARGFYTIVPPEYRSLGSRPISSFPL
jgi:predicted transcriptional regulator of viral defense system